MSVLGVIWTFLIGDLYRALYYRPMSGLELLILQYLLLGTYEFKKSIFIQYFFSTDDIVSKDFSTAS